MLLRRVHARSTTADSNLDFKNSAMTIICHRPPRMRAASRRAQTADAEVADIIKELVDNICAGSRPTCSTPRSRRSCAGSAAVSESNSSLIDRGRGSVFFDFSDGSDAYVPRRNRADAYLLTSTPASCCSTSQFDDNRCWGQERRARFSGVRAR